MFKRKKFMFSLTALLLMAFLLIGTLTTMGDGKSQELSDFVTVEIYNPVTGETETLLLHRVEAEAHAAAKAAGALTPRSSLENAAVVMGQRPTESERLSFNEMFEMSNPVADWVIESGLFYPDGPVYSVGVTWDGYFVVSLLEGFEYDKSVIERVYAAFEDQFLRAGLRDAPVIFRYSGFPTEDAREFGQRE